MIDGFSVPRDNAMHLRMPRRKEVLWSGVVALLGFVLSNCAEGCVAVSPSSLSQGAKSTSPGMLRLLVGSGFPETCRGLGQRASSVTAVREKADKVTHPTFLMHLCPKQCRPLMGS